MTHCRKSITANITRRDMLHRSSTSLTLAAAHALAPFVFSGCQQRAVNTAPQVKVGILHSQTGNMAISETSLRDAELMAIEQINADGGVLGHQIEPVVEDPRSRFVDLFPKKARKLLVDDQVAVVFGCWTSVSRKAVVSVFEDFNGLLFYPVQYEGNESSPNVVYCGSVPNQQILPAVDWLLSEAGGSKQRFYLVGSDYVFPWTANYVILKYLEHLQTVGVKVVGQQYAPLGHQDFSAIVQQIREVEPDVVFSTINGDSNIYFFNELAQQGVSAKQIPVVSTSVGEDELRSLLPREVKNHLSVWSYFQSLETPRNRRFVRQFQHEHGEDRVLDDPMEAAYSQVYLWKLAAETAGSFDVDRIRDAFAKGLTIKAPGGDLKLDPQTQHAYKRFRVGRIREDLQFDIAYESPDWIAPDPYPDFAFPGWHCDWTQGGVTQGPTVSVVPPATMRYAS